MGAEICYTLNNKINKEIRKNHLIPYHIKKKIRYESNKLYYSDYWGSIFKVISADYDPDGELNSAYIHYDNGYYGCLCVPLGENDYLLERDTKYISKKDIINSGFCYTGAEIRYWFFIKHITKNNPIYRGFWKYIDFSSGHKVCDTSRYFITTNINPENGYYINCKVTKAKG